MVSDKKKGSGVYIFYTLLELIYSNQDNDAKCYKAQRYYFSNRIIKNYNVIINGKNF